MKREEQIPEEYTAKNFSHHHIANLLKMFVGQVKDFHCFSKDHNWLDPDLISMAYEGDLPKKMQLMRLKIFEASASGVALSCIKASRMPE